MSEFISDNDQEFETEDRKYEDQVIAIGGKHAEVMGGEEFREVIRNVLERDELKNHDGKVIVLFETFSTYDSSNLNEALESLIKKSGLTPKQAVVLLDRIREPEDKGFRPQRILRQIRERITKASGKKAGRKITFSDFAADSIGQVPELRDPMWDFKLQALGLVDKFFEERENKTQIQLVSVGEEYEPKIREITERLDKLTKEGGEKIRNYLRNGNVREAYTTFCELPETTSEYADAMDAVIEGQIDQILDENPGAKVVMISGGAHSHVVKDFGGEVVLATNVPQSREETKAINRDSFRDFLAALLIEFQNEYPEKIIFEDGEVEEIAATVVEHLHVLKKGSMKEGLLSNAGNSIKRFFGIGVNQENDELPEGQDGDIVDVFEHEFHNVKKQFDEKGIQYTHLPPSFFIMQVIAALGVLDNEQLKRFGFI